MNTKVIIGIVAVVIVVAGVGIYSLSTSKTDMVKNNTMTQKEGSTSDQEKDTSDIMQKEDDVMIKKDDSDVVANGNTMMKAGSYEAYSPEKIARAEMGDVVLFFHASWCPSCRGLNADIEKNISSIPEGLSILKVDYDKELELKKKYGVTYQHTLVQVDKDGNLIKKWSGSPKLSSIVSEIK